MANTTEVDSWDYDDDYDDNADALEAMEVASLQELYDEDHDVESEPIREALYLATVNILVRATSPGHAAGIIIFALSDYDRDDEALVDWDYAVQDGERQCPKCVCLDLEPGNITELLDHIAT